MEEGRGKEKRELWGRGGGGGLEDSCFFIRDSLLRHLICPFLSILLKLVREIHHSGREPSNYHVHKISS